MDGKAEKREEEMGNLTIDKVKDERANTERRERLK